MEVKPGYKLTEVGVIPEDWGEVLLDAIAKRGTGHTPDKKHPEYWGEEIKWVSLQDSEYLDHLYISDTTAKITSAGIANSSAKMHPRGAVVLSRDAGVGKSAIMAESMAVSQHFVAWTCSTSLNNHYLYYWLQSRKPEFERIAMGNAIKTIGLSYFKKMVIPLPPLPEQTAIATTLSDVDALISSLDALISKKKQIKQGAMQELLSGKRRLPGFSGEWEVKRLGEFGSTYGGLTGKTKSDFGSGKAFYITFMNIMSNVIINASEFDMVKIGSNEKQNRVLDNDIFFNGSSETPEEVGLCAVLQTKVENVYLNSFCFGYRLHINESADGLFLAYHFRSNVGRELLKSLAQGATRYNLSKKALLKVAFPLPPLPEQQAIAAILSDMDAEITTLESRKNKTKLLKQGMMQELLTGRIRLIPPAAHAVSA
ncbi:MAG: restriction endonuclease subunit S [Acidithiobacillus ferriphilus]